jgi:aminopeptidase N
MPKTEIRPRSDIVALLCDADFKRRRDTNTWTHRDGRPFSKEEQALVLTATRVEVEEVTEQLARYREYLRATEEAPEAFQRFLAPFMEQLSEKILGNAVQLMSEDDRTEFDRLLRLVIDPVRPFAPYAF